MLLIFNYLYYSGYACIFLNVSESTTTILP
nr:MAG TPA: hypothetical protein [Crassvirales sp.]